MTNFLPSSRTVEVLTPMNRLVASRKCLPLRCSIVNAPCAHALMRGGRRRAGFTLTEMLVVVGIIVVLASIATPAIISMNKGRKVREAAQFLQGTLVRARDDAVASGIPVGIQLILDDNDNELVRAILLVEARGAFADGTCHIVRTAVNSSSPTPLEYKFEPDLNPQNDTTKPCKLVVGYNVNWSVFKGTNGVIRFEDSGPIYEFYGLDAQHLLLKENGLLPPCSVYTPPLDPSAGGPPTLAAGPFDTHLKNTPGIHYKIRQNTVPRLGAQPIPLPTGVVIDLAWKGDPTPPVVATNDRLSRVEAAAPLGPGSTGPWEILFSPSGQLLPPQSRVGKIGFWIREEDVETGYDPSGRKAIATSSSRATIKNAIIAVNTRTGYTSSVEPVFKSNGDLYDVDSYYDNIARGDEKGL